MAFEIPVKENTWEKKMKHCEAAKRKLIAYARTRPANLDENKFYDLLAEIDSERVNLRKDTPAEFKMVKGELPSESKYSIEIKRIRDSITEQDKDDIDLPSVLSIQEITGK